MGTTPAPRAHPVSEHPSTGVLWALAVAVLIGALGPWVAVGGPAAPLDGSGLGGHTVAALLCTACLPGVIVLRRAHRPAAAAVVVAFGTLVALVSAYELPGEALQASGGNEAHVAWGLLLTVAALIGALVMVVRTWAASTDAGRTALGVLVVAGGALVALGGGRSLPLTLAVAGLLGAAACLHELRHARRPERTAPGRAAPKI
jgi:hypothetical protein